ncbi:MULTISPECIES: hypothetical protein [unclassified Mesorhizobium]|uniref:hypothetical protein n=1 Tax=unclassified Mesorhizobium TaxID=325217 RepID=UPI0030146EA7
MTAAPALRFMWLEALVSSPVLKTKTGAIRTGLALAAFYYNEEKGMAWPSRKELARRLNSAPERVSEWLGVLHGAGAIHLQKKGPLAPLFGQAADPRSLIIRLDFQWAHAVIVAKNSAAKLQGKSVPKKKRSVTRLVTESMTRPVTYVDDEARHTNPPTFIQIDPEKEQDRLEPETRRRAVP